MSPKMSDYTAIFLTKTDSNQYEDMVSEDYFTGNMLIEFSKSSVKSLNKLVCTDQNFYQRSETGFFSIAVRNKNGPFTFLGMASLYDYDDKKFYFEILSDDSRHHVVKVNKKLVKHKNGQHYKAAFLDFLGHDLSEKTNLMSGIIPVSLRDNHVSDYLVSEDSDDEKVNFDSSDEEEKLTVELQIPPAVNEDVINDINTRLRLLKEKNTNTRTLVVFLVAVFVLFNYIGFIDVQWNHERVSDVNYVVVNHWRDFLVNIVDTGPTGNPTVLNTDRPTNNPTIIY